LLDEATLGCDVMFDRRGAALLLQFKLGEMLQRFRRPDPTTPPPVLNKPFWRFSIDTAEQDGQYDLLLKAEQDGGEVYYTAPRFTGWDEYAGAFEDRKVLERSLLIRPAEIDNKLAANGQPDGRHRIIYDWSSVYVCSTPIRIEEVKPSDLADQVRRHIMSRHERVDDALKRILESFRRSREIREPADTEEEVDVELPLAEVPSGRMTLSAERLAAERQRRLEAFRDKAKSEADAFFATVGVEAWAAGSQLIAVTAEG
jgi:hypothetical protein